MKKMIHINNIKTKKVIDISMPIKRGMINYPGNPEFEVETSKSLIGSSFISKIIMGSHTGTHIDAPRHAAEDAAGVDEISLEKLIGVCRVLDFINVTESIKVEDLENKNIKAEERILVKTKNSIRGFSQFYEDYIYLDSEAAKYLAEKKIMFFGIDYLSVKKKGSTDNRAHTELLSKGIPIFEGLDLSKVSEGEYFFIGLPLKLTGLDGSPTRAILVK